MSDTKNNELDALREKLLYKNKNAFTGNVSLCGMDEFCEEYKEFLDAGKTERLCVREAIRLAEKAGFVPYTRDMKLSPGDKIYRNNRGKALILAVIGNDSLRDGANIAAAHIDSPRIDLKQSPLYESEGLALFKTHYYGGIKKYQWPAIPLELYGVVSLKSGETIDVSVGKDANDPLFVITDLLPHLGKDQMAKKAGEIFTGESLNVLCGSRPTDGATDKDNDAVKLNVLRILNEKYGITEEDFLSAELCVVPAFSARDIGFDRSLIGAYGHDDRVCAYPSLRAMLDAKNISKTAVCVLADKEEIGSEGVSGMKSYFFDTFMEDICENQGVALRECYERSTCLSTDVTVAFDPTYPEVSEKKNSAFLNGGVALCKYTGARGKSGASDASSELIAKLRALFDKNGVLWQMAALGKVDQGGGGTVAMYTAERNIDTIDAGVPVLSMHSPFETVAKSDVFMTYKAICAFFEKF
ncbi:MAG: aminopeptidase [Oscillospiraceae bacterium]|nr:aminopeptidase [Oscillospiraceae bacterium]